MAGTAMLWLFLPKHAQAYHHSSRHHMKRRCGVVSKHAASRRVLSPSARQKVGVCGTHSPTRINFEDRGNMKGVGTMSALPEGMLLPRKAVTVVW